jgi:hypothetical protein
MPLRLLLPKIDDMYQSVCLHCHFEELWQQQLLLLMQTVAAVLFTVGYQTRLMAIVSWYMYTSLILRNTWLYFILDRYFYYLLFYAMFLPSLDDKWSLTNRWKGTYAPSPGIIVNPATVRVEPCARCVCIELSTIYSSLPTTSDRLETPSLVDLYRRR